MKIIETNNELHIYNDDKLRTHDHIPANYYEVRFSKAEGFRLAKHPIMQIKEDRVYGSHDEKTEKVLNSFDMFNRNLGVMLSGDKGMGKSLFARMLSKKAVERGLPVILVDFYMPGIMSYLSSIEQEAVILFDEFDKTFEEKSEYNPQYEVLNVLDGIGYGKKLYVFICNDLSEINDCMLNRPGRIHYHFRISYPTEIEIKQYLEDKLDLKYHDKIEDVIKFSYMTKLNYDTLRAIAFELNNGYEFKETINDLNILRNRNHCSSVLRIEYKNGTVFSRRVSLDLFDPKSYDRGWTYDEDKKDNRGEVLATVYSNKVSMLESDSNEDYFAIVDELEINEVDLNKDDDKDDAYYGDVNNVKLVTLTRPDDKSYTKKFF